LWWRFRQSPTARPFNMLVLAALNGKQGSVSADLRLNVVRSFGPGATI